MRAGEQSAVAVGEDNPWRWSQSANQGRAHKENDREHDKAERREEVARASHQAVPPVW